MAPCSQGTSGECSACELCAPGAFGPLCQGRLCCPALPCSLTPLAHVPTPSCLYFSPACNCTSHGRCDEGLGGSGSCFCDEGWTGPRCEVQLGEWALCLCPPCTHQCVPQLHTRTEGSPGGQPLTWMCGVGPGGQSCSLCVLRPAHPRPCAALATAVSAAWATKGTAVRAQVSRGGGPTPLPSPPERYLVQHPPPHLQWWTCARRGVVAAASMPTAARWAQRSPASAGQTTRAMAGAAGPATPVRMASVGAAVSTPTA